MRFVAAVMCSTALVGAMASSCGQAEGIGFGGAPEPPGSSGSDRARVRDGPIAPEGTQALPASQVDAGRLPQGYPRLVWIHDDGRTVGAYGRGGGCTEVRAELVEQTHELVRLRLVEVTTSAGPCTMELRFPPLTVQLDHPLGRRTVVLERETIGPGQEETGSGYGS